MTQHPSQDSRRQMSDKGEPIVIREPKVIVARTVLPHRVALMIVGEGNLAFTILLEPEQAKQIAQTIAEYSLTQTPDETA